MQHIVSKKTKKRKNPRVVLLVPSQAKGAVKTEKQQIAFKLFHDLSKNNLDTLCQLYGMGLDGKDLTKKEIQISYPEIEKRIYVLG